VKDPKTNQVQVLPGESPQGKQAITCYKTLETKGDRSLVECQIITGRTHQIRAQLAMLGTPIVGDRKYGKSTSGKGQALWAHRLVFPDGRMYEVGVPFGV